MIPAWHWPSVILCRIWPAASNPEQPSDTILVAGGRNGQADNTVFPVASSRHGCVKIASHSLATP